jgi:hypothetical protein
MVEATISIADSGRTFESRPDHRLGPRLWKGYEYMGRMQYILDNPTLCPDTNHASNPKKYQIVKPEDGLPGALVICLYFVFAVCMCVCVFCFVCV